MKVLPPANQDAHEAASSIGMDDIDTEVVLEDFVENERVKAANSPVMKKCQICPGQSAAADDDADIDVDDDKPDDTGVLNETEFQGMKIEVRPGIEVPKWLKLYEWGVEKASQLRGRSAWTSFHLLRKSWISSGENGSPQNTPRHCQSSFEATRRPLRCALKKGLGQRGLILTNQCHIMDLTMMDSYVLPRRSNTRITIATSMW